MVIGPAYYYYYRMMSMPVCLCVCLSVCLSVCVSVCLSVGLSVCPCVWQSVREHLQNYTFDLYQIFVHITHSRGSILLLRRCDTFCTSGFMYDVVY